MSGTLQFPVGNRIPGMCDYRFLRGIPAEVVWEVHRSQFSDHYQLVADGYGKDPGTARGPIFVARAHLEPMLAEQRYGVWNWTGL